MGCGGDPVTPDCLRYDLQYGKDAQNPDLAPESMDWVFSSHCLEHLPYPLQAIQNWWDIVKPGGHLIVSVPDWILYEQKVWPSVSNTDHKWTFSMLRPTFPPHSHHLVLGDLFSNLRSCQPLSYRLCDEGFNYEKKHYDRTWHDRAEAEIEIICKKHPSPFWTLL